MSQPEPVRLADALPRGLLEGLVGLSGCAPGRSLGLVGSPVLPDRPPEHCLRRCLGGEAALIGARGCAWLASAARGQIDPGCLAGGRCPQGFAVSARRVGLGGQPALALAVEGALGDGQAAGGERPVVEALEVTARLVEHIGQLAEENVGLAGEVLRNYEQLNLMFDFTRQIAHITDVAGIEQVLLDRLRALLGAEAAYLLCAGRVQRFSGPGPDGAAGAIRPAELAAQLAEPIGRVRRARQVAVAAGHYGRAILGPLSRLDERVDLVLALRSPASAEFTSGDMLLVESLLTFAGQIIANSELHEKLRRMSVEVTRALVSAIDQKDHYTSGHSERVGLLARLTGGQMGLPAAQLQVLEWAGLLHDVGKIGVAEDILNKPGRLSDSEFDQIKRHTIMGYEILKPVSSLEQILDGVLYHHECPDGSGYPRGLKGEQIPPVARIVRAADAFDALSSHRSYRHAFSMQRACQIIRRDAGAKIDARAAEALLAAVAALRASDPQRFQALFPPAEDANDEES